MDGFIVILIFFAFFLPRAQASSSKGQAFIPEKSTAPMIDEKLGRWTPGPKDAQSIESDVMTCLTKTKLDSRKYYRQYLGYKKNGRKMILINFLCELEQKQLQYWTTDIISVHDGGDCYAKIHMDMQTKKCDIRVNGEG